MAGNIRIIEPSSNFQKVAKGVIFCKEIDPFTLGIYVKVLALGKAWQLNIGGLASYLELTEAKIRKSFAILEQAGYMRRQRVRDEKNHFVGWDYEFSTIPFSDLADSRPSENPDVGKIRTSENQQVYNKINNIPEDLNIKEKKEDIHRFDFRASLLNLGVSAETADAWLEVRRRKGAVNTELAFKFVASEIAKTGQTAEQCIRIAAANSWQGFKAEYLRPRNIVASTPQAPRPHLQEGPFAAADRIMENIARKYQNLQQYDEQ